MALLIWENSFSVNIKRIDEEHQKLIGIINDLHDAMLKGRSKDVLGQILDEIMQYTSYHFSSEESLMNQFNFPGLQEHQQEHATFIQKAKQAYTDAQKNNLFISIDLLEFLSIWVKDHIMQTDKKYCDYLNNKGIH